VRTARVHLRTSYKQMAKRSTPVPQPPVLSAQEIKAAIARFQRRVDDLQKFDPQTVTERSDPRID
jgi:hypothetical protein